MIQIWVLRLATALEKIAAMIVSSEEYAFEHTYFMSDDPPPRHKPETGHGPGLRPNPTPKILNKQLRPQQKTLDQLSEVDPSNEDSQAPFSEPNLLNLPDLVPEVIYQ